MIQQFTSPYSGETGPERLALLRAEMSKENVDAFIIPRSDAHQGEEVTARNSRLAWLTGFTGSAGFCVALADEAGIFVDGRYTIQVKLETDPVFTPVDWPQTKLPDWLVEKLTAGQTVAFDPWLHTHSEIAGLQKVLVDKDINLVPSANLVDRIWTDQPRSPKDKVEVYPSAYAGEAAASKLGRLGEGLSENNHDAAILTTLDAIAWLTNTRGSDLVHMPVYEAFGVLKANGTLALFVDPLKVDSTVKTHLGDSVEVLSLESFSGHLEGLDGTVLIDPKSAPYAVWEALNRREAGEIAFGDDPTDLPKACKNDVELAGATSAHLRDGAAMVRFMHWLSEQSPTALTEIDVVRALEGFRRENDLFVTISFDTICGSGPNGAIVHYRVSEESNRRLGADDILLVDSGGQYLDGTTDITRTMALGKTTKAQCQAFTSVLKGMIALSMQKFPEGIHGGQLDAIARAGVWDLGLDYGHGTGHGVGAYLSVHEGPQRISSRSDVALQPGMILSNEPGFYLEGEFGIRIENLVYVVDTGDLSLSGKRVFGFETLTWAPIDRKLIVAELLSDKERSWLNAYHQAVLDKIGPLVPSDVRDWLSVACAPI